MNVEKIGRSILVGLILISLSYPVVILFGVSKVTLTILFYLLPLSSLAGYLFTKTDFPKGECEVVLRDGRRVRGEIKSFDREFLYIQSDNLKMIRTNEVVEINFNTSTETTERSEGQSPPQPF